MWQDEQTGPYFANMLDDFTGTTEVVHHHQRSAHRLARSRGARSLDRVRADLRRANVPKRPPSAAGAVGSRHKGLEGGGDPSAGSVRRHDVASSLRDASNPIPSYASSSRNGAGGEPGLPYASFRRRLLRLAATRYRRARVVLRRGRRVGRRLRRRLSHAGEYTYDASRRQQTTAARRRRQYVGAVAAVGLARARGRQHASRTRPRHSNRTR